MSNGADRCNGRVNATKGTADDTFESWVASLLMQSPGAKVSMLFGQSQRCYRVHAAEPASRVDVGNDPEYPDTKHARSRLSQPNPIILFVSVTPGTHWKNATSTRSGFAPNPLLRRKILLNLIEIQGTNFTRSECCNRGQADRHTASPVSPRMYPQMRAVESLRI